jgi:hypothetical protein
LEYINGPLKVKFGLDNTSKPKPVAGPDDLLLMLVHHWACDESVFPTEDNRHDAATIILFQAYTGGRPAEFVHSSKGKASQDPLGKAEDANKCKPDGNALDEDYDSESDDGDRSKYNNLGLFNDNHDGDNSDYDYAVNEDTDEIADRDSGYNTDGTDVMMTEDTEKCCTTEVDEFGEAVRKYKALCYEDICLWIVQNLKQGGRDLLAMEVHLRHHKGVDRKPKPCVTPSSVLDHG